MPRWDIVLGLAMLSLLSTWCVPERVGAQENRALVDFRERTSYTAEELGAALFPIVMTRGVFVRPPQAPSAAPLQHASVVIPVFFAVNSTEILPRYYADLDKLGAQLTAPHYLAYSVKIEGHTDNRGAFQLNQLLSEKRAQNVKHYLVERFAITPERLAIQGYGPNKPIAPNVTEAGRQKNRRIEIANSVQ
jgi:outer membrane protein OmpA-like peptidoglycan-associated protein